VAILVSTRPIFMCVCVVGVVGDEVVGDESDGDCDWVHDLAGV
jgi:hypothetical protein